MELSGKVMVLATGEVRDLGPDPVAVKPGTALPFREVFPGLTPGEELAGYSDDVGDAEVVRTWRKQPVPVPDRVTSRQFKLALHGAGLLSSVEAWVNGHPNEAVKIAYDNSGTFVRTEPMMAAGFADLGFTDEQIDAFFTAAAAI